MEVPSVNSFSVTDVNDKSILVTLQNFRAIDNDEFKSKLEDTLSNLQEVFENSKEDDIKPDKEDADINSVHDHITGMMDGKLGRLAKEIAEETASEINLDESASVDDLFKII